MAATLFRMVSVRRSPRGSLCADYCEQPPYPYPYIHFQLVDPVLESLK